MSSDTYLVTGAGGFVGGFLVRELLRRGVSVRAMVRSRQRCGDLAGLEVDIIEADLTDRASLDGDLR